MQSQSPRQVPVNALGFIYFMSVLTCSQATVWRKNMPWRKALPSTGTHQFRSAADQASHVCAAQRSCMQDSQQRAGHSQIGLHLQQIAGTRQHLRMDSKIHGCTIQKRFLWGPYIWPYILSYGIKLYLQNTLYNGIFPGSLSGVKSSIYSLRHRIDDLPRVQAATRGSAENLPSLPVPLENARHTWKQVCPRVHGGA